MKYEDLLNWKNKCFRKYCSTKLNWRASETIIIYVGGASWRRWHGSSSSAFFMQQDTTQWPDCLYTKDWGREREKKVHAAICVKKAGSITNLASREGQVQHGEVIIYCTSTRIMEDSSVCGAPLRYSVGFRGVSGGNIHKGKELYMAYRGETIQSFFTPVALVCNNKNIIWDTVVMYCCSSKLWTLKRSLVI